MLKRIPQDATSGPGWHWDSRGWVSIDGVNTVFSGFSTTATVDVVASGVTVRNVRISLAGDSFGIALRHTKNTTIEDVTVSSPDAGAGRLLVAIKDIYGDAGGTVIKRANISHVSTGIQIYSGLVQDNYIHDMGFKAGDHTNGTTSNGGTTQLNLIHNTVLNQFSQTDAISLFQDFGVEANRLISGNLLAGGGYTIYAGQNPGAPAAYNIKVTNNRISRMFFPNGGYYGPATAYNRTAAGNVWSGNTWDNTGATISQP